MRIWKSELQVIGEEVAADLIEISCTLVTSDVLVKLCATVCK